MTRPDAMGQVFADLVVIRTRGRRRTVRFPVGTGSTYTWIRQSTLTELGVKPRKGRQRRFRTIEGNEIRRPLGDVTVEYQGDRGPTAVVFARTSDFEVLGLHALETLGLEVDPSTRELWQSDAILAV